MPDIERQYYIKVEKDVDAIHEASKHSFGKW
jgi:hypothetical protein